MGLASKRFRLWAGCILTCVLILLPAVPAAWAGGCDSCIFVSPLGDDSNDGLSWAMAKRSINAAINQATPGSSIHVAAGTYQENVILRDYIYLLGGWSGEGDNTRDPETYQTVIQGTVTGANTRGGKFDGFTVKGGSNSNGGGIYLQGASLLVVSNNIIASNHANSQGGGVYLANFSGTFSNNTIRNNSADSGGGGIYCASLESSGKISNNLIYGNSAKSYGGGMAILDSGGEICSNTIYNNKVENSGVLEGSGGGVFISIFSGLFSKNLIHHNSAKTGGGVQLSDLESSGKIINCTVADNSARGAGDGILILPDVDGEIINCIFWGNSDDDYYRENDKTLGLSYSTIKNWDYGGEGNSSADPLFVNPAANNYQLAGNSPAIDSGDPSYLDEDDSRSDRGYTGWACSGNASAGNSCPSAEAGSSRTVAADTCYYDQGGGSYQVGANVLLDGSASADADGCLASYVWSENGSQIADGCNPTAFLAVGTHNLTLTVSDGDCQASDTLTIQVTSPVQVALSCPTEYSTDEGTNFETFDLDTFLSALDSMHQLSELSWSYSGGTHLAVSIDDNTHIATVSPNPGDSNYPDWCGSENITFTVTDPCGNSDTCSITFTADCVDDPPSGDNIQGVSGESISGYDFSAGSGSINLTTSEDTPASFSLQIDAQDVDGDTLSIEPQGESSASNGGTVTVSGGDISYQPPAGECNDGESPYGFSIALSDGANSYNIIVNADVSCVNDCPVTAADSFSTSEDQAVTINVLDNDSDPDNSNGNTSDDNSLQVSIVSDPGHGSAEVQGSSILYTPDAAYTGDDSFIYLVDDGICTVRGSVSGTISQVKDAPVISPSVPDLSTDEDTPVSIDLSQYETDEESSGSALSWSISGVDTSLFSASIDAATDVLTITPVSNQYGSDTVTLTLTDEDGLTDSQEITVTVNAVNDAPQTSSQACEYTITEGGSFGASELCNYVTDDDDNCSALTFSVSGNSELGVSISSGGNMATISTPGSQWCGSETLTFTAADPGGLSASFNCTYKVTCAPVISPSIPNLSTDEDSPVSIDLTQYETDEESSGSALSWSISGVNTSLFKASIDTATDVLTITPVSNQYGSDTVTLTLTDEDGLTDSQDITVTVNAVNDTPQCSDIPALTVEGGGTTSVSLSDYVSDPDSDPISWTAAESLELIDVSVSNATATLSATCSDEKWSEEGSITFSASDGEASCAKSVSVKTTDSSAPSISCASSVQVSIASIKSVAEAYKEGLFNISVSDNCSSNPSVSYSDQDLQPNKTIKVTFTASDKAGNSATCTSKLTVNPGNAPSISCTDLTLTAGSDCSASLGSDSDLATASDSDNDALEVTLSPAGPYSLGTTTVTATATDEKMGKSSSCSATVTVQDKTAPVISCPDNLTIDQESNDGISSSSSQVASWLAQASASDNCDSEVTISNDAQNTIPVGSSTITFTATDDSGNSATCSAAITVNAVGGGSGSSGTGSSGGGSGTTGGDSGTGAGGSGGGATGGDSGGTGGDTGGSSALVITSPADGTTVAASPVTISYTINGVSKSVSRSLVEGENTITIEDSGYSASIRITLDSIPPRVVITSPENGSTVISTPVTFSYLVDGLAKTTSRDLKEGINVVTIEEKDIFGRVGSDTVTIVLETKAPELSITSPEDGIVVASSPVSVSYLFDGELRTVSRQLNEGENIITIEESDSFGRKASDTVKVILNPDAPLVVITSPENGAVVSSSPITVTYTVDGEKRSLVKELQEGENTITVSETNAAGYSGSACITVTLDKTAPVVVITSPKDGAVVASSPITVTYTVDGSLRTLVKELQEGKNTITITETDSLGRSGSASIKVTLDTSAPTVVITSPKDGEVVAMTPITVTYTVDGKSKSIKWNLVEGPNEITITETNVFGRSGSASITVTLASAPLVCPKDITVEQETPRGTRLKLKALTPDPAKPVENLSSDQPKIFPPGTTTVTFSGQTKDGETVSCTCQVTVQDTTAPKPTLLLSPRKKVYLSDNSIFITTLVQDRVDPKPAIKLELRNGKDGKAKDITAFASLPLKLADYVGENTLTLTATDAAGNQGSVSVKFKVLLHLERKQVKIVPGKKNSFRVKLRFPKPYDVRTISKVRAGKLRPEKIVFGKKGKNPTAVLFFKGKYHKVRKIQGEFLHQGRKCRFLAYPGAGKDKMRKKPGLRKEKQRNKQQGKIRPQSHGSSH